MRRYAIVIAMLTCACGETPMVIEPPLELGIAADCNPLASSTQCLYPFPSRFFQAPDASTETGVRNAFHDRALPVPADALPIDMAPFNARDGHPPSAPLLVHLGVDVSPDQLSGEASVARTLEASAPIALIDRATGDRVPLLTEMDRNYRMAGYEGQHVLLIRPMTPLEQGHRYVAVLTTALRDAGGNEIAAPRGFAALRDGRETDHAALEASRADYEATFTFLAENGYPRDSLLLAWDFAVASRAHVIGGILSMREQALAAVAGGVTYSITNVNDAPANPAVARIVEGTFDVPSFLDDDEEIERSADGTAVMQGVRSFPFTMLIPRSVVTAGVPAPLLVYGHGVFGNSRADLQSAFGDEVLTPIAEDTGAIIIATDFIGLSFADQELIITRVVTDVNNLHVVTDRLEQSVINNLVLIELAQGALASDPMAQTTAGARLVNDEVRYYGISLGGITGVAVVALSRDIDRAVLALPGGSWSTILPRSVVYGPIKGLFDSFYPDPIFQQTFMAMLQARFDGSDGINLGQLYLRDPLPDAPPDRRILLIEGVGDCKVPNLTAHMLSRAMGLDLVTPSYAPVFGLTEVSAPSDRGAIAQVALPDRLATFTPADENVVPTTDNLVHNNTVDLPTVHAQTVALLRDGQVTQSCSGACDPD